MSIEVTSSLDSESWDRFVESSPDANVFHTRSFYEIFAGSDKYNPQPFFLVEDGAPRALVIAVRHRVMGKRLERLTSRALVYGGILWSADCNHRYVDKHTKTLIGAYDDFMGQRTLYSEIRNVEDATFQIIPMAGAKHQFVPHLNYLIDLRQGEDRAFGRISSSMRKSIRRLRKKGIDVFEASDEGHVDRLFDLVAATYARVRVPFYELEIFRAAWRILGPSGVLRVTLARAGDTVVAARAALVYNGRVYDWFAGTSAEGYRLKANALLVWEMIEWGCRQGHRVFDFGGAGEPGKAYGVRDFKSRFHGDVVNYGRFVNVYSRPRYYLANGAYALARRIIFR
jgi:hypothetical protein